MIDFPRVIDSSIRSAFVACHRQGFYQHFLHLRRPEPSIHLHFGKVFAGGLEATRRAYWRDGKDSSTSIALGCHRIIELWGDFEPPDSVLASRAGIKSVDTAIDALISYFENYTLGSDTIRPLFLKSDAAAQLAESAIGSGYDLRKVAGEPAIEMSFALPIPDTKHPQTGEPVIYCGRFDMLGIHQDAVWVVDEKTTISLGSWWASSFPLRAQLTGYVWGARQWGINPIGAIIRGVGIQKGNITFDEVITSRPEWHVEMWLRQLSIDVNKWVKAYKEMYSLYDEESGHLAWDQNLDAACSAYGGCGYTSLCDTADPRRWYSEFVVAPWNPLTREESIDG